MLAGKRAQPRLHLPLVTVDVQAQLSEVTLDLYNQIDKIHPCGIENPEPIFWTANAAVVEQKVIGKSSDHLKLTLAQSDSDSGEKTVIKAIAWRWGMYHPLPRDIDIAYKIRLNEWKGRRSVEIELVGVRPAKPIATPDAGIQPWSETLPARFNQPLNQPPSSVSEAVTAPVAAKSLAPNQAAREIARALQQEINGSTVPKSSPTLELPPIHQDAAASIAESVSANDEIETENTEPENTNTENTSTLEPTPNSPLSTPPSPESPLPAAQQATVPASKAAASLHVEFYHSKRRYRGTLENADGERQLTVENAEGHLLVVQMSRREGFLYLPGESPQPVDIAELRYFNLIRAGLSALEIKQKTKLLIKQEELISEKDGQIRTLKAQMALLEEKITQLSAEQQTQLAVLQTEMQVQESTIQGQEAHIEQLQVQVNSVPLPTTADIKQQVRTAIGDSVWFCLQSASQKDLQAAYKNDCLIHTSGTDANIADYSEAGIRLSFAVEREVLMPFFTDLADYLRSQGVTEIGGIALSPGRKYTLGMLPPLLADQWRSFQSGQLSERVKPENGVAMVKVQGRGRLSGRDRTLLTQFFDQWEHPMAACFGTKGRQAASSLDQISKLRNIAAHGESFLYRWQYELLHQLIAGAGGKGGLLRQLFAVS